jgi:hypothetical protein
MKSSIFAFSNYSYAGHLDEEDELGCKCSTLEEDDK